MKLRRGRKAVSVVFVASIAAGGVVLVTNNVAEAATPTLTVPGRVYPTVGTIMDFSGSDPTSGDSRAITVTGLAEGPGGCDTSEANNYSISDCARIQMSLGNGEAGLLRIEGNTGITDLDGDPEVDVIVNDTGAVIEATDSHGEDSVLFNINGTQQQIQDTLDKLQFVPCSQQQGTIAPIDNEFEVECGLRTAPTPEPGPYEEKDSLDGELPTLSIQAINPNNPDPASESTPIMQVKIKVEGTNNGPTLSGTTSTVDAPAGGTTSIMDVLDVDDTDMCSNFLCPGDGYDTDADATHQEGDDAMLVVLWLAETSGCGTFDPRGDNFFPDQGGATAPTVDDLVQQWTGLDLNDSFQATAAQAISAAVQATLSPNAWLLDLTDQSSSTNVTAWAAIGGIDDVKYTLGGIDYNAPADDATCHLNVAVSDLGNNGAPTSYVGSPFGPETPFPGDPGGDTVPYELPNALATSTSLTLNVTDQHPDVTISQILPSQAGDPAGPNKPSGFRISFSEPVEGFDVTDLSLSTSSATGPGFGLFTPVTASEYTVLVTATSDGKIKLTMNAGAAYALGHPGDSAYDNDAPVYDDNEIEWDQTGPTVTIDKKVGQADPTSGTDVVFTVKFSDTISTAPVGFDDVDVDLSASTTGPGTHVSDVTQPSLLDLKTYEVTVTGMTTPGNVIATIPAGAIVDTALNGSQLSTSTDNIVAFDNQGPDVTIAQGAAQDDPTIDSPIVFDVHFTENVTDFATGDVTFGGSALPTAAVVTGSGMDYTVAVSGMSQDGDVTVSIAADKAHDGAGNANTTSTTGDDTVTFDFDEGDATSPSVTINQNGAQADPTSTPPIVFDVVFSEPVSDFATGDVTLTGTAGATTAAVTGSGMNYTVSVTGMTTDGTVIASVNAGVAHDAANNPNTVATFTDRTVVWVQPDVTGPTVTIDQAGGQGDPTAASPILFTVVFDESVSDFTTGDVALSGSAGATTAVVTGSGMNYTVAVSGMTGDGDVTASINAGVADDAANNPNDASTSTDNTVTFDFDEGDVTAPTVTIDQAGGQLDPATTSPILFTVVFSEPVVGFDTTDVDVSGTAGATTGVVTGSGANYSVSVSDMTSDGTVTVAIPAAAAKDAANHDNAVSTSSDGTVVYDTTAPTVTITPKAGQANPTNQSPIVFTVTFSEGVTGFATGDVTVAGTAGATTGVVTPVSASVYDVAVSNMATDGTVTAIVGAAKAFDLAGHANVAADPPPATVVYDTTAPTVTIDQDASQVDPATATPIVFTVDFNEDVSNFTTSDITVGGTAGATTALVSGGPQAYTVAVSGMTQDGSVTVSLTGVVSDAAGNVVGAATLADNTVTFDFDEGDITGPGVQINQKGTQGDPTTTSPIQFDVVFTESVADFATGDVTVGGTAGATTAVVTGSGTTYSVSVSGMTQVGTVIVTVNAGVAHDAAANANAASTSSDNTVAFNSPVISVSTPGGTVAVTVISGGILSSAGTSALQVPPPNGVSFPFGQLDFTATGPAGGLVTFQLTLPSAVNDYYKLVSNAWQQFPFANGTGAVISNGGTTVTVTIRDDGPGDSNPAAGIMTDPAAPAVVAQVPPTSTTTPATTTAPTTPPTTPPTTNPTTTPGALPPTGSSSTSDLVVIAALLLGIGLLLAGARRRQSNKANA